MRRERDGAAKPGKRVDPGRQIGLAAETSGFLSCATQVALRDVFGSFPRRAREVIPVKRTCRPSSPPLVPCLAGPLLLLTCVPCAMRHDCHAAAPDGERQQAANPADAIVGVWKPADMDVNIQIFSTNGQYAGAVVKAANPALINSGMLRGVVFNPASNTWQGEVFAMKLGKFVPMTIRLTATGFEMVAGSGLMSKTVEWRRVT